MESAAYVAMSQRETAKSRIAARGECWQRVVSKVEGETHRKAWRAPHKRVR